MDELRANSLRNGPDEHGRFGQFGGRFVAETLMPLILDLERAYRAAQQDPEFQAEMAALRTHYVGRPSPLYFAERLSNELGGAKVYFKREDLNHTGSHKINNCLGQILLAKRMGKTRIIAETGAADGFRRAFLGRLGAKTFGEAAYERSIDTTLQMLSWHLETYLDLDQLLTLAREPQA